MAARTADTIKSAEDKAKKQAGTPRQRNKDETRQTEPGGGTRPARSKQTDRPHPEAAPRRRPSLQARQAPPVPQETAHSEPSDERVPVTQAQALQELVRRAGDGNQACRAGLRELLDKNPSLWEAAGNVAALAERHWVEALANGNALAEEAIPRRLRALKSELLGSDPTPLERLLVDVIAVSYLAAEHGEIAASLQEGSLQQLASRLRRAESGQLRLLRAVKTLATVRALLPRALPEATKKIG